MFSIPAAAMVHVSHNQTPAKEHFDFHLRKNLCYSPLLVLQGIYHYWTYFHFFRGPKQVEVDGKPKVSTSGQSTRSEVRHGLEGLDFFIHRAKFAGASSPAQGHRGRKRSLSAEGSLRRAAERMKTRPLSGVRPKQQKQFHLSGLAKGSFTQKGIVFCYLELLPMGEKTNMCFFLAMSVWSRFR